MLDHSNYWGWNKIDDPFVKPTITEDIEENNSSGSSTPPLWRPSSPSSRAEEIARGQRELMEMVRNMPESTYELSLRDIVEHQHHELQDVSMELQESSYIEERCIINKKEMRAPSLRRKSAELNNGAFLLKMGLPVTRRSVSSSKRNYQKKNSMRGRDHGRVSPKHLLDDDKEWWKKRECEGGESESTAGGFSSNNGSSNSSGSDTSRSNSGNSSDTREGRRGGCWSFIFRRRKPRPRSK